MLPHITFPRHPTDGGFSNPPQPQRLSTTHRSGLLALSIRPKLSNPIPSPCKEKLSHKPHGFKCLLPHADRRCREEGIAESPFLPYSYGGICRYSMVAPKSKEQLRLAPLAVALVQVYATANIRERKWRQEMNQEELWREIKLLPPEA
jgi:hypothetical protein